MIVDVVIVYSVMGLQGWESGEGGQNQWVGQLLPGKGPEWMGIRHHEQNTEPPSKLGLSFLFLLLTRVFLLTIDCVFCKYKSNFVCRLKINHAFIIMRLISWKHSHGSETVLLDMYIAGITVHYYTVNPASVKID